MRHPNLYKKYTINLKHWISLSLSFFLQSSSNDKLACSLLHCTLYHTLLQLPPTLHQIQLNLVATSAIYVSGANFVLFPFIAIRKEALVRIRNCCTFQCSNTVFMISDYLLYSTIVESIKMLLLTCYLAYVGDQNGPLVGHTSQSSKISKREVLLVDRDDEACRNCLTVFLLSDVNYCFFP